MKILRRKLIIRVVAMTLTAIFLQSTLAATISWALTSGPHQPEYMGYEEPGASDMVNLLTGDFSFRVPALTVPGPEGGFSMPLSYKSGIGLEQEGSWVGLGWSMNAGAITRNVVEYPDDANGEIFYIHRENDNLERGWNASIPAIGRIGWNSNDGHTGRISILGLVGASYDNGSLSSGNLMGVDFSSKDVNADPVAVTSAIMTVATLGYASAVSGIMEAAKQVAVQVAVEAVTTAVVGVGAPGIGSGSYWKLSRDRDKNLFYTNYWIYLDQTRHENMYGVLQLGNMPRVKHSANINIPEVYDNGNNLVHPIYENYGVEGEAGAASDMHYAYTGNSYYNTVEPTSLAKDQYSVAGPGISGGIQPNRLDVGALSMPRQMSEKHIRMANLPFKESSHKVQFLYNGSVANSYYHQVGGTGASSSYTLDLNNPKYGIDHSVAGSFPEERLRYQTNDPILPTKYNHSASGAKLEANRAGLYDGKIAQQKHIQWYTQQELASGVPGFIDYLTTGERTDQSIEADLTIAALSGSVGYVVEVGDGYASMFQVGQDVSVTYDLGGRYFRFRTFTGTVAGVGNSSVTLSNLRYPDSGASWDPGSWTATQIGLQDFRIRDTKLGALRITREDGKTYYYTLPVYEWDYYSYVQDIADPDNITTMSRLEPFASTWLLTAITGSDFVDRNNNNKIDDDDWGYWVKFDYGKFSNDYAWRIPYEGYMGSSDGGANTYVSGRKEQYYLNSIHTRTHTALFIKGLRKDGKGYGEGDPDVTIQTNRDIASSLYLDEIVLLKNEAYNNLVSAGLSTTTNTSSPWLMNNTDTFAEVYDLGDISSSLRTSIDQKALKRLKFSYDYSLCAGALNSFDIYLDDAGFKHPTNISGIGKLTLKKLSFYGSNNTKVVPDFIFDYAYNPNYQKDKWDGWGYYTGSGSSSHTSHKASSVDSHGYAWSLNSITTPMGNTVSVEYERDTYSSISGKDVTTSHSLNDTDGWYNGLSVSSSSSFTVGEPVTITGTLYYTCDGDGGLQPASIEGSDAGTNSYTETKPFAINTTVTGKGSGYIEVAAGPPKGTCSGSGALGVYEQVIGTVSRIVTKKGGDIRVKSISVTDGNKIYKTRYEFEDGVVAKEPDYIRGTEYDFYNLFDYPMTSVMYGSASVYQGKNSTTTDYHTKQVYQFTTPHYSMVTKNTTNLFTGLIFQRVFGVAHFLTKNLFTVDIETSSIGNLRSIKTYNSAGELTNSTVMSYSTSGNTNEYNNLGVYAEGTFLLESVNENLNYYHRAFRTTKRYYPNFLTSITTTNAEGYTSVVTNKTWDFISGRVVAKETENAMGIKTLTETIPAYKVYPEMGPKAQNSSYTQMLGADAAVYSYKLNASGAKTGLLGASVQTWKKDWNNYRVLSNGTYSNASNQAPRWRRSASYIYQGEPTDLKSDGTLTFSDVTDRYVFSSSSNPNWQYNGEILRFDNYSLPVETRDLNDIRSVAKTDVSQKRKVLEAGNARYTEVAYSGVENGTVTSGTQIYADGEVRITGATVSSAQAHTGIKSVAVSSAGQKAFHYVMTGSDYDPSSNYRVSVWVYNSASGVQLYYKHGSTTYTITPQVHQAGNWVRLEGFIPASALSGSTFEVGCKATTSGTKYFDDFRFQPADAGTKAYVYNDRDELTFVLDNENMFTEYEYNDAGRLVKTYTETFRNGRVLTSKSEQYYKEF